MRFGSQSAMEYLMTYGWAVLIIAVVLAVLYSLGLFSSATLAESLGRIMQTFQEHCSDDVGGCLQQCDPSVYCVLKRLRVHLLWLTNAAVKPIYHGRVDAKRTSPSRPIWRFIGRSL